MRKILSPYIIYRPRLKKEEIKERKKGEKLILIIYHSFESSSYNIIGYKFNLAAMSDARFYLISIPKITLNRNDLSIPTINPNLRVIAHRGYAYSEIKYITFLSD